MLTRRDGVIGFLGSQNRVNVMLSRARDGMFILGHPDTLLARSKATDIWPQVNCRPIWTWIGHVILNATILHVNATASLSFKLTYITNIICDVSMH